jgi:mono/diheme cytochrome c family protein
MKCLAVMLCAVASAQDLPEGQGREVVEKICSVCHGTDLVASARASRKGWEGTVEEMYARGASSTEAEKAQILDYLSKYLAK